MPAGRISFFVRGSRHLILPVTDDFHPFVSVHKNALQKDHHSGPVRLRELLSEIFGHGTDLPWGMMFVRSREWHEMYQGVACHPTQIYEALCYFALFALLMWMYWKKNAEERPGLIFGVFFLGIFVPRFLIEFIKNDQVAFEANMSLNMGQWLSVPCIAAGVFFVCYALSRPKVHLDFPNRFADEKPVKKK